MLLGPLCPHKTIRIEGSIGNFSISIAQANGWTSEHLENAVQHLTQECYYKPGLGRNQEQLLIVLLLLVGLRAGEVGLKGTRVPGTLKM